MKANRKYCVYKHTCPNGKVYIGITCQKPEKRWGKGHNYKDNNHFYNAIVKYGWDNIKHEILFKDLSSDEAYEKEVLLIALYKSNNREYGYNKSIGGESGGAGIKFSEERVRNISNKYSGKGNPFYNKHHTEEAKDKIRSQLVGRKHTEKEINKMIEASPKKKTVNQYTLNNILVCTYESKRQAIRETGIDMGKALTGTKKTAGGYIWRYAE